MTDEEIKESIAPCGLCCETCFAHVDGDIRTLSLKLKEKLGNFHLNAKRFETLLENPIFSKYPDFKEMLDYFAAENCRGCRNEQCKLFRNCGIRKCHQEKQIDFCYQCDRFPCEKTNFDPGLHKAWVIINEKIRTIGIEPYCQGARTRCRYP
ncbi:DUF3795 domain-containing protein [Desulfomonile tiedjei]|uniref:DUF3795 domain-containing protein n=1 Tax=Desulfomonile tiedjei (strain ATCC 49306 / DSM 6799 / DCB-1) TaxID=706587 RepID=I4CDM8_DESTA|nr:DUF3795 domain-containing protein [Desulfomonile tiedjei]AFM27669.1 hypothetical protein Desti_5059 [Desulfomonile tiedjei DSM 6799]